MTVPESDGSWQCWDKNAGLGCLGLALFLLHKVAGQILCDFGQCRHYIWLVWPSSKLTNQFSFTDGQVPGRNLQLWGEGGVISVETRVKFPQSFSLPQFYGNFCFS